MVRPSTGSSREDGTSGRQATSGLRSALTRSATAELGGHISLVDHTKPDLPEDDGLADLPSESGGASPVRTSTHIDPVSRTATHGSLRETLARRKYRKYQEERTLTKTHTRDPSDVTAENSPVDSGSGAGDSKWGRNRVDRGKSRVGEFVSGKRTGVAAAARSEVDSSIDILYENQRGFFLCGIPRFSAASLFPFDPAAWLDGHFKPSAVTILNAQVPDPSWAWDWRTWYVDMSHDVDEEGWEYSFWFPKWYSWHGTHPWFHSFVRRRRWIRKRVRRQGTKKPKDEAHALNPDYFTIHTKTADSVQSDDATSLDNSKEMWSSARPSSGWGASSWQDQQDTEDIDNISALMKALRKATIDREKLYFVKKFTDQGGDELHYLADEIPHIMSLLVFQNSRRQLLKYLIEKYDAATEEGDAASAGKNAQDDPANRKVEYFHKAVEAADEQCKRLEYWSDVRGMVREGNTVHAAAEGKGWGPEWEGIDAAGPDPDAAKHTPGVDSDADSETVGKGKGKARAEKEDVGGTEEGDVDDRGTGESHAKESEDSEAEIPQGPPVRTHGLTAVQPEEVKE